MYLYSFDYAPLRSVNWAATDTKYMHAGAFHGADVMFVFNDSFELSSPAEHSLANAIVAYWTNLAWSGSPNSGGERPWHHQSRQWRSPAAEEAGQEAAMRAWDSSAVPASPLPLLSTPLPAWPQYQYFPGQQQRQQQQKPSHIVFNITKGARPGDSAAAVDIKATVEDELMSSRCALFGI